MSNAVKIIAGSLKNRNIKMPKGSETRPALVLVRRVICDTLTPYILDSTVLDLFAGTGAFVFEMISRGAGRAVANDLERPMSEALIKNSQNLGIADQVQVLNYDYLEAIKRLGQTKKQFDIIFVAPPFYGEYVNLALEAIHEQNLLAPESILIAHYYKKDKVAESQPGLKLWKQKIHGNSIMDFFVGDGQ